MDERKIAYLNKAKDTNQKPGTLVYKPPRKYDNYGGGGGIWTSMYLTKN